MNFTRTDLFVIIAGFCLLTLLVAMVLPALGHSRPYSYTKHCTNNLKQIGLAMQMYFSDGSETIMPHNNGARYLQSHDHISRLFELEPEILSCRAKRNEPQYKSVYVMQRGVEGTSFEDIENPSSSITMDGDEYGHMQVHKNGCKLNVLFGDGHVESIAP